jgi:arylsulfatase/arylsulfatase A
MNRPNVLLVVLDSVRAANVSLLGYEEPTTPVLERFARWATTYRQARAPGTWSLPSHVSLFTGRSVPDHGVTIEDRLDPGHTVFEELAGRGYETGVFSSNVYITAHPVGIGEAFDTVCGVPREFPDANAIPGEFEMSHPDGFWYADRFHEWVEGRTGPWAACVNVMDGHRPYLPRPEYDGWGDDDARQVQRELGRGEFVWNFYGGRYPYWYLSALEGLYDGAIRQADAVAERILEGLGDRLENTLVVVCADHGDGLGERSAVEGGPRCIAHTLGTHEALLHVPLVVKLPGQHQAKEIDDLATLQRFPDAVRAVVDGDDGHKGRTVEGRPDEGLFVAEGGTCLVSRGEIDGPKLRAAREYCGDGYEGYVARASVVYEDRDVGVGKVESWGDRAAASTVYGPRAVVREGEADAERVRSRVESERGPGIATPRETDEEGLPEEVRRHLADIGYL